jgi:glycosidase
LEDTTPGWWKDAVIYQIFPRAFKDNNGDGTGDIAGITSKLDYITNIGFNGIWTCPIFVSPSYHGYDTVDYSNLNSDLGTMQDFSNYINSATSRGVHAVLDLVLEDTSALCPWFLDAQTNGRMMNSYIWTNSPPAWDNGAWSSDASNSEYYYQVFGYPQLNLLDQPTVTNMFNISRYWESLGVDGFRLDAAQWYIPDNTLEEQTGSPETLAFITNYEAAVKSYKSSAFTVGEVSTSYMNGGSESLYYENGSGLDMVFSFDFPTSVLTGLFNADASQINSLINNKPASIPWTFFAPILDSHDSYVLGNAGYGGFRFMDAIGGDFNQAKLAAALLLTFAGTPFIYYGTEIGMESVNSGDTYKRRPMQWDSTSLAGFSSSTALWWNAAYPAGAAGSGNPIAGNANPTNVAYQLSDPNSLLNLYKKLIAFRKANTALTRGNIRVITTGSSSIASFIRPGTNYTILVVANLGSVPGQADINFSGSGLVNGTDYKMVLVPFLPNNTNTSLIPATNTNALWPSMYVLGDFNSWNTNNPMTYEGNFNWKADISLSAETIQFIYGTANYMTSGQSWGVSPYAGYCTVNGNPLGFTAPSNGTYHFLFNQSTLAYSVQ